MERTAIILAAGQSTRFRQDPENHLKIHKLVYPIFGTIPIINWNIMQLAQAGAERIIIVTGYLKGSDFVKPIDRIDWILLKSLGINKPKIDFILNGQWDNPRHDTNLSLLATVPLLRPQQNYLVCMGDHVFANFSAFWIAFYAAQTSVLPVIVGSNEPTSRSICIGNTTIFDVGIYALPYDTIVHINPKASTLFNTLQNSFTDDSFHINSTPWANINTIQDIHDFEKILLNGLDTNK